jgi:hypothetical protein
VNNEQLNTRDIFSLPFVTKAITPTRGGKEFRRAGDVRFEFVSSLPSCRTKQGQTLLGSFTTHLNLYEEEMPKRLSATRIHSNRQLVVQGAALHYHNDCAFYFQYVRTADGVKRFTTEVMHYTG